MQTRQLIGPFKQLIPLSDLPGTGPIRNDQLRIIRNAGIVVKEGCIQAVGDFKTLVESEKNVLEIEGDVVGLPGFIDAHTHLIWGGSRENDFERRNSGMSYQEILQEGGGIFDTVNRTRASSDADLTQSLMDRSGRHLKSGVTTIEVKTGYGLSKDHEIRLLNVINDVNRKVDVDLIPTFLGAHVCPGEFERETYLEYLASDVLPEIVEMTKRVDIFIEDEAFNGEVSSRYLKKASDLGFQLTAHAGQFSSDGVRVAVECGALSADHLESISKADIEMLAKSKTVATALPGASLGLGMSFAPLRKILDAGGSGVIATDWNPGSAPMGDLLTQASILATYEKLTFAEVLAALTFRAARALDISDRGILSSDNLADIVAFPASDYREILYHQGQMKPKYIWKKGVLV